VVSVLVICCFNKRGLVSWKFGTRLRLSHGLSTHFLHHEHLIGLLFLVTASIEGGDVSNNLHPKGHVKSHLEIGWQNLSLAPAENARTTDVGILKSYVAYDYVIQAIYFLLLFP
jgi:hypothetical protein